MHRSVLQRDTRVYAALHFLISSILYSIYGDLGPHSIWTQPMRYAMCDSSSTIPSQQVPGPATVRVYTRLRYIFEFWNSFQRVSNRIGLYIHARSIWMSNPKWQHEGLAQERGSDDSYCTIHGIATSVPTDELQVACKVVCIANQFPWSMSMRVMMISSALDKV